MKNDEQLLKAFQNASNGVEYKQDLCDLIEEQVLALVLPVLKKQKESEEVTLQILLEICKSVEDFNLERNIKRQIASFTSIYLYNYLRKHGTKLQTKGNLVDYEYMSVKEDHELHTAVKNVAKVFRDSQMYKKADRDFKQMNPMDIVLIELFAYETYSIDQLEDMLELDSVFLCNAIQRAKCALLGIEVDEGRGNDYEDDYADEPEGIIVDVMDDYDDESVRRTTANDDQQKERFNLRKKSAKLIRRLFPNMDKQYVSAVQHGILVVLSLVVVAIIMVTVQKISSSKKPKYTSTVETTASEHGTVKKTEEATTKKNTETTSESTSAETTTKKNTETTSESTSAETTTSTEETTTEAQDSTTEGNNENNTSEENTSGGSGDSEDDGDDNSEMVTDKSEDTGAGDGGSGNAGAGDGGSGNTGSGNTGTGDTESGNAGTGDTGSGNAGIGDTGSGNAETGETNSAAQNDIQ